MAERRRPLTQPEIFAALDAHLDQHGREPTLDELMAALGGGTYRTLMRGREAWSAAREAAAAARAIPVPEAARTLAHDLLGQLWDRALGAADARLEAERRTLAADRARWSREADEAADRADRLTTALLQTEDTRSQLAEDKARLEQEAASQADRIADLEAQAGAVAAERDRLQTDLERLTRSLEATGQERSALMARVSLLEDERAAAKHGEAAAREETARWRGQAEALRAQHEALLKVIAPLRGGATKSGATKARRAPPTNKGEPGAG